jgi:hypothetical protein
VEDYDAIRMCQGCRKQEIHTELSGALSLCILPHSVLYGYETWSLTLREERRLRVFENRALRRIFRPKRD